MHDGIAPAQPWAAACAPCAVAPPARQVGPASGVHRRPKADPDKMHRVGAPMPGAVVEVAVKPGAAVEKDDTLIRLEAMKVQLFINSPIKATVKDILVKPSDRIDTGDLLLVFE